MGFNCICFGEVLFDVLPHERKAGGSPMNVAYHLTTLGQNAGIISRAGNDNDGKELRSILEKKNVNLDHLQIDHVYPTGIVLAIPSGNGDVKYDIKENAAWDYIELKSHYQSLINDAQYFIFGSLAARSTVSRNTLFNLMDIPTTRVFDVNLRSPYINKTQLEYQFSKTDILKMNEEELDIVTGWYVQFKTLEDKIKFLQNHFQIPEIIITCGAVGAVLNIQGRFYYQQGYHVKVSDTIGSGDSFVAGYLSNIINHQPHEKALQFACALGAFVAAKAGGCPSYSPDEIYAFMQSTQRVPDDQN